MNLLNIINIVLLIGAVILIIPCLVLFVECLSAFVSRTPNSSPTNTDRPKTTVLIPAHNEAEQIEEVLKVLLAQITDQDRVIVIADNCHDNTAELARSTGVTVLEREHLIDRGKGFALDYAMEQIIKDNPPEVLVILDGDCIIEADTIANITYQAISTGRPVQATYLMEQPENPSIKDNVSMFALKVKNLVRLLGLNRLGGHCLLTGSGMAFPWQLIEEVSLAGSKTTDDMQLTVDLALAGSTPVFCENAMVLGRLMKDKDATSQRSRWEHGHLEMILVEVPRLIKAFIFTGNLAALGLALDISVPPLSLLIMTWLVSMVITWLATILGGTAATPAIIVSIAGGFLISGVFLAWSRFGRSDLPFKNLLAIPFYILGKLPIYLKFLIKPQSRWLKTERDLPNN